LQDESFLYFQTISGVEYVLVRPRHSLLYFPAVEHLRSSISKAVEKHGNLPVVLDCRNVHELDFTAARGLGDLHKELSSKNIPLLLMGPIPEVKCVLKGAVTATIRDVFTDNELDAVLQESISDTTELKDVISPLLSKSSTDTEADISLDTESTKKNRS
jgi:solute carrier family 26 (sodium-independent sulfate anion transporter), member 11